MKDRLSRYAGRIKLTPVPNEENLYDMQRADQPIEEGTPLNKSTLLKDETAELFGLDNDATVNDALNKTGEFISSQPKYIRKLFTEIIDKSMDWKAPEMLSGKVFVRIFGAGGGGFLSEEIDSTKGVASGSGGGYMETGEFDIVSGATIPITIAPSTEKGQNGAPSSFGIYLSANGGERGTTNGGNGGSGGGGGGANSNGGNATYGGGGGAGIGNRYENTNPDANGGNGGIYGGGGGGSYIGSGGVGGIYGGNGGGRFEETRSEAEDGTNTINMGLDFEGQGLAGQSFGDSDNHGSYGGGGGYGGNGGNGQKSQGETVYEAGCGGGGGGGFGGNGGNGSQSKYAGGGGGGGGFGGNGGNGETFSTSKSVGAGGGGGGYGPSGNGGSYSSPNGGYAAGAAVDGIGGQGICILTYYAYVLEGDNE